MPQQPTPWRLGALISVALALMATVMLAVVQPNTALAYDQVNTTNGSMSVSTTTNSTTASKTWDSLTGSKIKNLTLNYNLRPASSGSTSTNDAVRLYYRTSPTGGYNYYGQWNNLGNNSITVDLSAYGATGIQTQLVAGSVSTNNPLYVSVGCDNCGSSTSQWMSPGGAQIRQIYFSGTTESCCDRVSVYGYRNGNWSYLFQASGSWGQWYDLTPYGTVTGLYLSMSTDSSVITGCSCGQITKWDDGSGAKDIVPPPPPATLDVPTITTDEPPYTPSKPALSAGPLSVQSQSCWGNAYSQEFTGSQAIQGARFTTNLIYGDAYLQGWNGSTWVNLRQVSYTSGPTDQWVDLRSSGSISKLRIYLYTCNSYGNWPSANVPEIQYTWGGAATATGASANNTVVTWTANGNPAGTTYELWRRTYSPDGSVSRDEVIYTGTGLSFTTVDQQPGVYYRFRVRSYSSAFNRYSGDSQETAFWTAPTPTVVSGRQNLSVSWTAPYPGLTYRVNWRQNGTTSWSNTTTTAASYTISSLSAASSYNVALSPVLPEGGPEWWGGNQTAQYSPHWPPPNYFLNANNQPTATTLSWSINGSGGLTTSATIRVTRNGSQIYQGVPSYSWYNGPNGVYELWASFNDSGLATGTRYDYVICSVNTLGECAQTATLSYTPVPNVPSSFAIDSSSTGLATYQTKLSWAANGNAANTTYELWRKTWNASGAVVSDDRIYSGTALTYTTAGQTEGKYYTYRVRAVNVSQSAFTSELAYHTMPMPATAQQNNQLALTWSKLYPNLYYQVWYAQENDSTGNIGSWQGGWNVYDNTSYSIGLSPLYRYKTKLRPYSLPNGGVYWDVTDGQWYSPLWPQISYLRFVNPGQTSVTLKWPNQNINSSATIRIKRDGNVVYQGIPASYNYEYDSTAGGYYYVASWTDTNLQPGLQYSYEICAVNALGDCGTPRTQTFLTLPPTPDSSVMDIQFGSHGWRTSSTGGAWAELSFETVQSATSYKLYVSGGADGRTLTVNPPVSGTGQKYKLSDLLSGVSYSFRLSAVNGTGEGSQSAAVTFSTPARSDSTAPTSVSMAINDGAATTGGSRVRVRGTATDLGSGVAGYQISNDNSTWSTTYPLYDFASTNLITYRGGNAFFTDLAGWQTDTSVWAKVNSDPTAEQGGKAVAIRWDGTTAGTRVGLKLADTLPVTGGKEYTLAVRYKVTGLVTGSAGIFGNWTGGGGGAVDFALPAGPGGYQTQVLKMTAPGGATARTLVLGFSGANAGATLTVDWITFNEGPVPIVPANTLTNPVTNAVDWTIPNTSFGTKTIYTRYVDVAGNMTSSISATIQFMLTDTTAPRVTALPNGGAGTTDNPTVVLTLTATDDSSGPNMLKMRFSTDGLIWSPWESFQPTKTWNICGNLTPALCEGQRQIWAEVQDPAQNTGGAIASIFFRQSVTPVADRTLIWATSGSTGEYDTGSGTMSVQFLRLTEVGLQLDLTKFPGVKTIRYGFDPNRYGQWESIQSTKTLMLPNIQGVQTLYVQTDTGQQLQIKFLLDYTAPEVSVKWAGGATMTRPGGKATLVIDALDNLARNEDLMVSVNGAPYVPWAPTLDVTLTGTGLQTVSVRVKDPAGNVKQTSLSIFAVAQ